jgi:zinc transporter ZupT
MTIAWLLTLLAIGGVAAGVILGQSRFWTSQLGAAGGGLLFGIALFWVVPEIAEVSGWITAAALALAGCILIGAIDTLLMHTGHSPRSGAIAPLLAATAVHCFLDGWSVRALGGRPMTDMAVAAGLALHKIPEGLALGWVMRRAFQSARKAVIFGSAVELLTAVAAWEEPMANASGVATLGAWWTAGVLAIISGSFLYLGFHVVVPERHKRGVVPLFAATLAVTAVVAWAKR